MESERLKISNDYLRGLVEGGGSFTFTTSNKRKVPAFSIQMNVRDKELLMALCNRLNLPNEVYEYPPYLKDDYKRGPSARLIVREYESLRDKIIPFFYKKLMGNKGRKFNEWLEKMGSDPKVSKKFKTLYQLHKDGYYDNPSKKWFWEEREVNDINIM